MNKLNFVIVFLFINLFLMSGCNTVKGTMQGFGNDMRSMDGNATTSHSSYAHRNY